MKALFKAICLSLCTSLAVPAGAAVFDDPTWPCVQRKVESLSLGIMWPHPVSDAKLRDELATPGGELVETLVLRRVDLEEAEARIAGFAETHPDLTVDDLGHIFRAVFERISRERTQIMDGIARYSLQQIALSEAIDEARLQMTTLMEAAEPDFDTVDQLEEKIDWDERIFRDRAQSLTYVCETPVLLEKRAYAIAQILLKYVPK